MMSSATSTDAKAEPSAADFRPWHIYALFAMVAAAAVVWFARNTEPLALVLLSAAAIAAGLVTLALHHALAAFLGKGGRVAPLGERRRDVLEREKALVLRSIKELEFDRAMGKVGEPDFSAIASRLRARALTLMQDLEQAPAALETAAPPAASPRTCPSCATRNDPDAKFCKSCGQGLAA
jgi:hypothetical protein